MDRNILIIEDDEDHRFIVMARLMGAGLSDVKVVSSLEEEIQACSQRPRDVLIVDSGVIGENKEEAVKRLRERCPDARMIGYSAGADKGGWADVHVAKGSPFDEFLAAIRGT